MISEIIKAHTANKLQIGVDPRPWLEDVLVRISECEKNQDALRELLQNRWQKVSPNDA
jgi:hypothetical protein